MSIIGDIADGFSNWLQSGADAASQVAEDEKAKEIQKNGDKIEDERDKNHEQQDDLDEQIKDLERQKKELQSEDEEMAAQQEEMGYTDENRKSWEEKNGKDAPGKQSDTSSSYENDEEFDENTLFEEQSATVSDTQKAASANTVNISIGTGAGVGTPSVAQTAQQVADVGLSTDNPAASAGLAAGNWLKGLNQTSAGMNYDDESMYANADMDYEEASQQREMSGGRSDAKNEYNVSHQELLDREAQSKGDMAEARFGGIEEGIGGPDESFEY